MATLVLTAVGTVVGGPIGGAIGAFVGQPVSLFQSARLAVSPRHTQRSLPSRFRSLP